MRFYWINIKLVMAFYLLNSQIMEYFIDRIKKYFNEFTKIKMFMLQINSTNI
jgi:diacylglycerol kinase